MIRHHRRGRNGLVILLITALTFIFSGNVIASPAIQRIAGYTQYDTSAAIAKAGWDQSDYAVLAYGENFPDALAAAPLAKKYNAPILLTERLSLTPVIKQTLQDLKVKNVLIVGGNAVISPSIESQLHAMSINVSRYAGYDQYETAIEIAKQLGPSQEISVVTGTDFADALSIASVSAMKNMPIILVTKDNIPISVASYLSSNSISHSYVVGSTDQISDSILSKLPNAERISGEDKYSRNIAVLKKFEASYDLGTVFIATGNGFADALSGTAYAAKISAAILLVDRYYFAAKSIKTIKVLGGEAVIPSSMFSVHSSPSKPATGQNLNLSNIDIGQGDCCGYTTSIRRS